MGIMEKKMEATILSRIYIGVIQLGCSQKL